MFHDEFHHRNIIKDVFDKKRETDKRTWTPGFTFADAVTVVDESIGERPVEILPRLKGADHARLDLTRQFLIINGRGG